VIRLIVGILYSIQLKIHTYLLALKGEYFLIPSTHPILPFLFLSSTTLSKKVIGFHTALVFKHSVYLTKYFGSNTLEEQHP
jgi:hypothetical protein